MDALHSRLAAIFNAVIDEATTNQEFAAKLERALRGDIPKRTLKEGHSASEDVSTGSPRRSNRRAKAAVDPFTLLSLGEQHLRAELAKLTIEQLKDIVAEYGMDTSRLALKWKSPERLIDFVVTTVAARNRKGDVFRDNSAGTGEVAGDATPKTEG